MNKTDALSGINELGWSRTPHKRRSVSTLGVGTTEAILKGRDGGLAGRFDLGGKCRQVGTGGGFRLREDGRGVLLHRRIGLIGLIGPAAFALMRPDRGIERRTGG